VVNLPKIRRKNYITLATKKAYKLYSGCKTGDQGKRWAPYSC